MRIPMNPFARVFAKRKGEASARQTIAATNKGQGKGAYGTESDYSDFDALSDPRDGNTGGYTQATTGDVTYRKLPEVPTLKDPTKPNAEVSPADLLDPDSADFTRLLEQHGLTELVVVNYVLYQQRMAAERRYLLEREWALSLAYYEGRQWLRYDDNTQRLMSLINDEEVNRYITINLVAPFTDKLIALSTMTEPDANPAPLTTADVDKHAAAEARAIGGYCSRKFDRPQRRGDICKWASITGTGFEKVVWDGEAEAMIPKGLGLGSGPDGAPQMTVQGADVAPVGDIDESVVPPFELFLDPAARKWEDVRWAIHAKVRPLTYFQETYPERGFDVESETLTGGGYNRSWVDTYLSGGGPYSTGFAAPSPSQIASGRSGVGVPKTAVCYELWELPTPRFPDGRLIVIAGKKLLHYGPWPYAKRDSIPFVPTFYRRASDSPYGIGAVRDAVPIQLSINRIASSLLEQIEAQFDYAIFEAGSDTDIQEFLAGVKRTVRKVPFRKGTQTPPVINRSPGMSMDRFELLNWEIARLEDTFGIHDVSKGSTPPGVTAGISIDLLQQSDQSQLKLFTTEIEKAAVALREWELSLFAEFASVPRLMGLDESGNPQEALTSVQTFEALTKGGQTRIIVTPGSAMPKSPAGKKQEILEFYNLGLFGPPGSPPAAQAVMKLLDFAQSDVVIEAWQRIDQMAQAQMQAQNQQQQALQAQQLQAQQQTAAMNAQAQQQTALAQTQAQQQGQLQQAQIQQQTDLANAQMQGQQDFAQKQAQQGLDQQGADADAMRQMALAQNQHQLDVTRAAEESRIGILEDLARQHLGLDMNPMQEAAMNAQNQLQLASLKAKQSANRKPALAGKK